MRDELLHLSDEGLAIADVNRNDREQFVQYRLHPFVLDAVRDNLPDFCNTDESYLENLTDRIFDKSSNAFNNKLFYKQLALAECWTKLSDNLKKISPGDSREY